MFIITRNKKSFLKKRYIKISWILLEHKCLYYALTNKKYDHLRISDKKYDLIEKYYTHICKILKIKPSITKIVGFDKKKPSCNIIMKKLISKKETIKIGKILKEAKEI